MGLFKRATSSCSVEPEGWAEGTAAFELVGAEPLEGERLFFLEALSDELDDDVEEESESSESDDEDELLLLECSELLSW